MHALKRPRNLLYALGTLGVALCLGISLGSALQHAFTDEAAGLVLVPQAHEEAATSTEALAETVTKEEEPLPQPPKETKPASTPPEPEPASPELEVLTVYLTGYTYWDNTPPGSSDISHPIVHQKAGGTGTYTDPITLAVGHSIINGKDILDYSAGTRFYLPYLKKYFIAEDTCGDGNMPQNGPCHTGYEGHPWLDLWLDGSDGTRSSTDRCASEITDLHKVIIDPPSDYEVVPGSVYQGGCAVQFGDELEA